MYLCGRLSPPFFSLFLQGKRYADKGPVFEALFEWCTVGGLDEMSNFEKKYGKYAVRNLSLMLIMCYVVGYVISLINQDFLYYLTLNPYAIIHGQVWRLFTWIVVPPSSLDPFTIIMLLFYYNIGTSLERTWGTYRYNVYLFSGILFTILGSFVWLGYYYLNGGGSISTVVVREVFQQYSRLFNTYYINMSIFLAFAATFPETSRKF